MTIDCFGVASKGSDTSQASRYCNYSHLRLEIPRVHRIRVPRPEEPAEVQPTLDVLQIFFPLVPKVEAQLRHAGNRADSVVVSKKLEKKGALRKTLFGSSRPPTSSFCILQTWGLPSTAPRVPRVRMLQEPAAERCGRDLPSNFTVLARVEACCYINSRREKVSVYWCSGSAASFSFIPANPNEDQLPSPQRRS